MLRIIVVLTAGLLGGRSFALSNFFRKQFFSLIKPVSVWGPVFFHAGFIFGE